MQEVLQAMGSVCVVEPLHASGLYRESIYVALRGTRVAHLHNQIACLCPPALVCCMTLLAISMPDRLNTIFIHMPRTHKRHISRFGKAN